MRARHISFPTLSFVYHFVEYVLQTENLIHDGLHRHGTWCIQTSSLGAANLPPPPTDLTWDVFYRDFLAAQSLSDRAGATGRRRSGRASGIVVSFVPAGTVYGVAKKATVHAVRVLGCSGSGSNAGVIAGVDWVANNAVKPAVGNMSLGGGDSPALDQAVENVIARGISMAVAAGNDSSGACSGSPYKAPNAITVGSTDNGDRMSSFSNFGACIDIFAPGGSITSADSNSNTGTSVLSGTSMASPHVAGAIALILGDSPNATPAQVRSTLVGNGTSGKVTSIGANTVNLLLHTAP